MIILPEMRYGSALFTDNVASLLVYKEWRRTYNSVEGSTEICGIFFKGEIDLV